MLTKRIKLSVVAVFVLVAVFAVGQVQAQDLDTVIGETEVSLNGERQHVRTQETNLGNLVTDILRWNTGADVAVYNGGGIRASAELGEIPLETPIEILNFDNEVQTLRMSGLEIKEMLEHAVSGYPEVEGRFLQISGMRYYFNPAEDPGHRVNDIYIDGRRLKIREDYVVATNEFLAAGGDDYEMMGEAEILETFENTDQQMLINYIQENSPLFPVVEGRIVVINE